MNCQLYRHFDRYGKLLYIGISQSGVGRFRQHAATGAKWIDRVRRMDIVTFRSESKARRAEHQAIKTEHPPFNSPYNLPKGKPFVTLGGTLRWIARERERRDREIIELRQKGWRLARIADKFKLTRERVRQIVSDNQ